MASEVDVPATLLATCRSRDPLAATTVPVSTSSCRVARQLSSHSPTADMSEKWNAEEISKFSEIYESYECLWDIRNIHYMNRNKRDMAMNMLAEALTKEGLQVSNIEFLRKKIKVIKNVYRQELVKIEKSKKSGAGLNDIYQPRPYHIIVAEYNDQAII